MGCGCQDKTPVNAGKTTAELNQERPFLVQASDGSEQRFDTYDDAHRWARRVGGQIINT